MILVDSGSCFETLFQCDLVPATAAQTNPVASTHTASAGDVFVLMTISLAESSRSASKVESDKPETPPEEPESDRRSATVGKWNWTSLGAMTCDHEGILVLHNTF